MTCIEGLWVSRPLQLIRDLQHAGAWAPVSSVSDLGGHEPNGPNNVRNGIDFVGIVRNLDQNFRSFKVRALPALSQSRISSAMAAHSAYCLRDCST